MKTRISDQPLVSFITVNYNNSKVTIDLLKSLDLLTYRNFEIIIVDNASAVNPKDELLRAYPEAIVIVSEKNLGFAGGNNLGVKVAKGELLFFINNDTEVTPNLLEGLIEVFHTHEDAGAVSPKFHYFFDKGRIEYAGYNAINTLTGRGTMIGSGEIDKGQHDTLIVTNCAHGGGMMVPRYVIDTVGMMPEFFFLYYEELDWCEMIKRGGFKIYYQPKSLIYHKESQSTGKESPLKTYYLTRNRILFMRRNASASHLAVFLAYFTALTLPKNIATLLLKGQVKQAGSFIKGVFWNLTHFSV